jgi:hypothetical protein
MISPSQVTLHLPADTNVLYIRAYWARKEENETRYLRAGSHELAFIDRGHQIRVANLDDETLLAALTIAKRKWGGVVLTGTDDFKRRCVTLAVKHGIEIHNPELQPMIQAERDKLIPATPAEPQHRYTPSNPTVTAEVLNARLPITAAPKSHLTGEGVSPWEEIAAEQQYEISAEFSRIRTASSTPRLDERHDSDIEADATTALKAEVIVPESLKGISEVREALAPLQPHQDALTGVLDSNKEPQKATLEDAGAKELQEIGNAISPDDLPEQQSIGKSTLPLIGEPAVPLPLPERERKILEIARKIQEEQAKLRADYGAAYTYAVKFQSKEPKGLREFFGESEKHKIWSEQHEANKEKVYRLWEACGGNMDAADHGTAEANRRLTPEYARSTAEGIIAEEERQQQAEAERLQKLAKEREKIEKARNDAKLKDTVVIEIGSEATCHMIGHGKTFAVMILKIDEENGKIIMRCGEKDMVFGRETVYFTEPPSQTQKRDRRIAELDNKLNNPPNWIGSAGYPRREAAEDVQELVKLESIRLYDESDGRISEQDALKKIAERHPVVVEIQEKLERGRGMGR